MTAVVHAYPTISRFRDRRRHAPHRRPYDQLAASGDLGQVVRTNHPVAMADRLGVRSAETVGVVGCWCAPPELLARAVCAPRAELGDLVAAFRPALTTELLV
jgi:hypothetical protein